MSVLGSFRYSSSTSGATAVGDSIYNISAFRLSGLSSSAGLACCLYVWDATSDTWIPMTQP